MLERARALLDAQAVTGAPALVRQLYEQHFHFQMIGVSPWPCDLAREALFLDNLVHDRQLRGERYHCLHAALRGLLSAMGRIWSERHARGQSPRGTLIHSIGELASDGAFEAETYSGLIFR